MTFFHGFGKEKYCCYLFQKSHDSSTSSNSNTFGDGQVKLENDLNHDSASSDDIITNTNDICSSTEIPHKSSSLRCSTCQKSFLSKSKFKQHALVHTGQRPYACTVCHQAFNVVSNLRRHVKTIHDQAKADEGQG